MPLTLGSKLACPNCGQRITIETKGFFSSLFMSSVLTKFEKSGCNLTCERCGKTSYIPPQE
ncbi:MAG: hypothetical protein ACXADH_15480 [Candidatus Kariarchaeaceae archaeon]